jgi:hypothetical protein
MNFTKHNIRYIIPTSILTGALVTFDFNALSEGKPCKSRLSFILRSCFDEITNKTTDANTALNQEKQSVLIAPNPTKSETTVEYKGLTNNSIIELFDLSGRLLEEHSITDPTGTIILTTSNYPSGIYIVVMKSNGTLVSQQKLIIQ